MARSILVPMTAGSVSVGCQTCRLIGVKVANNTGGDITVSSLGRTTITLTAAADGFYPCSELLKKADGTASATYAQPGALIHDTVTVADSSGAGATVTLFYT